MVVNRIMGAQFEQTKKLAEVSNVCAGKPVKTSQRICVQKQKKKAFRDL